MANRITIDEYITLIDEAKVYDVASKTPLALASNLSARLGNRIFMKREDLQPVFSFKLRGAYNKLATLPQAALDAGVICSSAGNHAQGVALAAQRKDVRAVIVMPNTTPTIKIDAVRALGGDVILHGDTYDDAYAHARELEQEQGLTFIHPFNDPAVIAGQGTIGRELLEQLEEDVQAVFVPIGGGGLIAGIAAYVKGKRSDIKIIGVQPEDSAAMKESLAAGELITLNHAGIFADGVAVRRVGDETFRLCQQLVDEIVTVDTDQICAGIRDVFEDTRSIVEPAGALAIAGAKKYIAASNIQDQAFVVINCGANVNFDRLRHIAERAAVGEQREMLLGVEIPEEPGSFRKFCEAIGRRGITEFNYRYSDSRKAHIFVGVELRHGADEHAELIENLTRLGFPLADLSDNEMAKLHVRHMVGGSAAKVENERIFRFEFPERPGALLDFLKAIGTDWNISLFHYRNHGSDYGRILAGIQVPDQESDELEAHLSDLGYTYSEESNNPAYTMFLS
ncbi:threonine deaminase [uncultured Woeseiaceae bacterium]|uniref:L-threonine dehydratase n=1 Tax=uncultured Woeseiaceae bacterium TaxID=1983305 RepID=A0A7D9H5Z2_9GAMM|nr:threonine deaminase [uncultured Woeseiaceae bacterium]